METKLITCPTCKGRGTQTITAIELIGGKWEKQAPVKQAPVTIDCITCDGRKKITPREKQILDRLNGRSSR